MEINAQPLQEQKTTSKSKKIWTCVLLAVIITCCYWGVFLSIDSAKALTIPGIFSLVFLQGMWFEFKGKPRWNRGINGGILFVLTLTLVFGVAQLRTLYKEQQLKKYGVISYAKVVEVYKQKRLKGGPVFLAAIEYKIKGKDHYQSIDNKKQLYGVNDTLKIVYSSRNPDILDVKQHKKWNSNTGRIASNAYENMAGNAQVKEDFLNIPPQFRGGMSGFATYLRDNLVYPRQARAKKTEGKVYVSFVVQGDGTITDVKAERGIGDGCDEAAVEVIKNSPPWLPGVQNGKPVRVKYNIPITFTL
ncbi:energy transducer TonB [Pedobacter foliorum]|uniref:energy transducer TonB n=1 Tax=Pedobacter foliorum TaxID=2739058 RepID=UPI001C27A3A2|nr:energy transducer TonB [Pedobacter foliorum]